MGHGKSPSLAGKATINGVYLVGGLNYLEK
jgi:hypothetical protein